MLAAFQAPVNGVTDPIKTQQGYYVMKVLERVPPDANGFAAEKDKVMRELRAQKQSQVWQAWVEGARAGAKVEVSPKLPTRRG